MPAIHSGWYWSAVALLLVLFIWGASQMMMRPLESGDIYPAYSTLRADPLGAKALFESLSELPGLSVARVYKELRSLDHGSTILVLGTDSRSFASQSKKDLDENKDFLQKGGRIVIAFLPLHAPSRVPAITFPKSTPEKSATQDNGSQNNSSHKPAIETEWHVSLRYKEPPGEESYSADLPKVSSLYFDAGPEWTTVPKSGDRVRAIERQMGNGTMVFVADSYPLSNQGLLELNDSAFIAQVIGPSHYLLFDESHLGVVESGSVAVLIRKYRLGGGLTMILIVALLFTWRSASSFLPARENQGEQTVTGRDSRQGFAALLHRSVSQADLLDVCFAEWRQSAPGNRRTEAVQSAIKARAASGSVEAYRAACRALTEGK